MELLGTCLNLWAFIVNLAILLVGIMIFRGAPGPGRASSIGGLSQSLAFVVAIVCSMNMLMNLSDPTEIGPQLAFVLTTILYGAIINVGAKVWERVQHRNM